MAKRTRKKTEIQESAPVEAPVENSAPVEEDEPASESQTEIATDLSPEGQPERESVPVEALTEAVLVDPEEAEVLLEKAAPQAPVINEITMDDAAKRFVIGYRPHWQPSIDKFAISQGFRDKGSIVECKRILALWGAKLK